MSLLQRENTNHIARLTLNSPANYNALSNQMLAELTDAFAEIAADRDIRVVVLAANGKAFSAGHDLKQMQDARGNPDGGRAAFDDLFSRCGLMMQMIPALP